MVSSIIAALGGLIALPGALAGFAHSPSNLAVYWGQNSANQAGSQQRLGVYCTSTPVNIIPIAFLSSIKSPTLVNFASAADSCTRFPGSSLLSCPEIEEDIHACQAAGKTLLLSLGGATYTEGGFSSVDEATTWAETIWAMFGPSSSPSVPRPFGSAVIDGFDFDFEAATQNMAPFAMRLRQLMDAATASAGRQFYLAAAPQCPYPDRPMDEILQSTRLDFVMVQFYNNWCGTSSFAPGGGGFNFATWDQWARGSENPNVKVLVGIPGSPSAAGSGYVDAGVIADVIAFARSFPSFGGVMVWDMSQIKSNGGFLESVAASLGEGTAEIFEATTSEKRWITSTRPMSNSGGVPSVSSTTTLPGFVGIETETEDYDGEWVTSTVTTWRDCSSAFDEPTEARTVTATTTPVVEVSLTTIVSVEVSTFITSTRRLSSPDSSTGVTAPTQSATERLVSQWGQCGGRGYSVPTECEAPYKCVSLGEWWSHCN
ncbi:hypothetical protein OQA88_9494 [Cercophora sp. LCS_1]